jgi:hypothetical protein
MPRKPESLLTARILKRLREDLGGFWVKISGSHWQTTGLPDIIGCWEGLFFGFEVKMPKGKLTARQTLTLSSIATLGKGVSGVIYGPDEAVELVKRSRYKQLRLYGSGWLPANKMQMKIGLMQGEDRPISLWKLKKLVEGGELETRLKMGRKYYRVKKVTS